MEYIAQAKNVRVSPRKVRLVADTLRKKSVTKALQMLVMMDKRGGTVLEKTLRSAVANALQKGDITVDTLMIKAIDVVQGQALKRFHPSTRGRVHPYKRRGSHIKIVLEGGANGTKN
jgi:large subunit ribosomal protein L22